jgi:predicted double-glycine peptidase
MQSAKAVAWITACLLMVTTSDLIASDVVIPLGQQRLSVPAKSLLEIRDQNLVRQGWDISCGAAALSTILTYDFDTPYSEATIAVSILANGDPDKVKARGGFSLFDLKLFAEAVGYTAKGYADLTLDDLALSSVPAILPVRIRGLDHFVVYRGQYAGRVRLGDPAFGNITLSARDFDNIWQSRIGFFVTPKDTDFEDGQALSINKLNMTVPDLNYVERLLNSNPIVPYTRRPRPGGAL